MAMAQEYYPSEMPLHPGEVLMDYFMVPLGISLQRLSAETNLSVDDISSLLAGQSNITDRIAIALARTFSTNVSFWHRLQDKYDRQRPLQKSAS